MMPQRIDRIDDRLTALQQALATALPARDVEMGFTPIEERADAQLKRGVLAIVNAGEGDYADDLGMIAREGTLDVKVIAHLQVDALTADRAELQQAEIDLIEEFKQFCRAGLQGFSLVLTRVEPSRLLDHPYGWFVADLELRPPMENIY